MQAPDKSDMSGMSGEGVPFKWDMQEEEGEEEAIEIDNITLPEDMYGFALTSLLRDSRMVSMNSGHRFLRLTRLVTSQIFMLVCIFTQAFLLMETKTLVTSFHVHEIRNLYDRFEFHMYGEKEANTWITVNGKHRGYPQFWDAANFETLDEDIKEAICVISLSRPTFFMVILVIWCLTCLGEVKACVDMAISVCTAPTIRSMANSMIGAGEGREWARLRGMLPEPVLERVDDLGPNELLVIGITYPIKAYVLTLVMLPRMLITLYLLWLGCRWLLATSGFEDVLLNAVALEFILVLKNLLYDTVLPERNKREVQNTVMLPFSSAKAGMKEKANVARFFGSFTLFVLALVWAYVYVFKFQTVLPGYNWDVRGVCHQWLAELTDV